MKHVLRSLIFVSGLVAVLLIGGPAGAASKVCSSKDLSGDYLFANFEIRNDSNPPAINYCETAGTASFDGVGVVTISGTLRCNAGAPVIMTSTQYFLVNPDCSFLVSETSDLGDPVHGQIVENGHALIIDGTMRTYPAVLVFHGVAMKQ